MSEKHGNGKGYAPPPEAAASTAVIEIAGPPAGTQGMIDKKLPAWSQPDNPGMRFEIRTPNRGFNEARPYADKSGKRCELKFTEGVAYSDDEGAAEACRSFGYEVIDHRKKSRAV